MKVLVLYGWLGERQGAIFVEVNLGMFKEIFVSSVLNGYKVRVLNARIRKLLDVLSVECLRTRTSM